LALSMRLWPRSIQWQMLAGLLLLESLSIGLFAVLLVRQQTREINSRTEKRLSYEAESLALQSGEALSQGRPGWIGLSVKMMGEGPSVAQARVTDPNGNMLFVGKGDADQSVLESSELAQIQQAKQSKSKCFTFDGNRTECVHAIYTGQELRGLAWVEFNAVSSQELLRSMLHATEIFGVIWLAASALLVIIMAHSIARPLAVLHRGARALMNSPEDTSNFPLPVDVSNEIGDLVETFNRMVASLAEQRSGLNDTLSLLDSMLANAPIGLAFIDRDCRIVRVNQVFADLTGIALNRHLGRTLPELLPQPIAENIENAVLNVFANEQPVYNFEIGGGSSSAATGRKYGRPYTWLVSAYPVRTTEHTVRWAGVIVLDASERKRSEEALRKSEKLAVTGRLAASIAHEINNPLEAITNLLFLLRNFSNLDDPALHYVKMTEYEVRRISEITQQTLRFYRQSTLPARATLAEMLDSVLSLYQGRFHALDLHVERRYNPNLDLFCFAGEIRQVLANLVGNAIDATDSGGRILVRARPSRDWKNPERTGIRFVVADTGAGMSPEVRDRIFEAFYTTKEVTGTGLGLWVSHEIIVKHHGFIRVRSRAAERSLFVLPRPSGTVVQFFIPDKAQSGTEANAAEAGDLIRE
jgi:PAS domain S-box-containing protein